MQGRVNRGRAGILDLPITFVTPAAGLRPFVAAYWFLDAANGPPHPQTYIPGLSLAWIFNLGTPGMIADGGSAARLPQSFVKGPASVAARVTSSNRMRNYGIAFNPGGASVFSRTPLAALHNEIVDISAVEDRDLSVLAGDVASMVFERAVERFDRFLLARLHEASNPHLGRMLFENLERRTQQPLASVVDASGYSDRHMRRLFQENVGTSPKAASRICRLRNAVRGMSQLDLPLSQIAARSGYFDQAHLNREFREMIGCGPNAYRQRTNPISTRFNNFDSSHRTDRSLR